MKATSGSGKDMYSTSWSLRWSCFPFFLNVLVSPSLDTQAFVKKNANTTSHSTWINSESCLDQKFQAQTNSQACFPCKYIKPFACPSSSFRQVQSGKPAVFSKEAKPIPASSTFDRQISRDHLTTTIPTSYSLFQAAAHQCLIGEGRDAFFERQPWCLSPSSLPRRQMCLSGMQTDRWNYWIPAIRSNFGEQRLWRTPLKRWERFVKYLAKGRSRQ